MSSAKPTPDTPDGFLSRWSRRKVQARGGMLEAEAPAEPAAGRSPPAVPTATGTASAGAATAGRSAVPVTTGAAPSEGAPQHRAAPTETPAAAPPAPPPPTMEDVARLTQDSDYSRFVGKGVDPGVKNAALHKLFADPHFNVMDGLDIYIDDYNTPDPLPAGMLEKMVQSEALGLFTKTPEPAVSAAPGASGPAADHPADPAADPPSLAAPAPTTDPLAAAPADSPRQPEEARPHEDPDLRLQPHHAAGTAEPAGPGGHGAAGPGQDPGRQR
jgi:hypothetical protein